MTRDFTNDQVLSDSLQELISYMKEGESVDDVSDRLPEDLQDLPFLVNKECNTLGMGPTRPWDAVLRGGKLVNANTGNELEFWAWQREDEPEE